MIYRLGVILVAVTAGAATGAFVFKIVGEERVGAQIKILAARFGQTGRGDNKAALDLLEKLAPGTKSGMESAVIGTVLASLIAATAVTIAIREVAP